jgi:hypothetical protein
VTRERTPARRRTSPAVREQAGAEAPSPPPQEKPRREPARETPARKKVIARLRRLHPMD